MCAELTIRPLGEGNKHTHNTHKDTHVCILAYSETTEQHDEYSGYMDGRLNLIIFTETKTMQRINLLESSICKEP
jgi:hypothetical protein